MRFVLVRDEDGKYVAPAGIEHSYTASLEKARKFVTKAEAERDACGNERAVSVDDLLGS